MFRIVSGVILLAAVAGMLLRRRRNVGDSQRPPGGNLFAGLFAGTPNWRSWRGAVIGLTQAAFVLLVLSGFVPILIFGGYLSGYPLLLHLKVALPFVILLAVIALASVHDHRLERDDWQDSGSGGGDDGADPRKNNILKSLFWIMLATILVMILSIVLGMFPIFSSAAIGVMLKIHGFSALFLIILVMLYVFFKS